MKLLLTDNMLYLVQDGVYGVVIMTKFIARVTLVYMMNVGHCLAAADSITKPTTREAPGNCCFSSNNNNIADNVYGAVIMT